MAYTRKLVQTRLTKDTSFFVPASNVIDRINQYVSEGKAQALKSVTSEDGFTNTTTVSFTTEEDWINFKTEDIILVSESDRENYCYTNSISCDSYNEDILVGK